MYAIRSYYDYSYDNWSQTSFSYGGSSVSTKNFYPPSVPKYNYLPSFNFFGLSYYGRYYYTENEQSYKRSSRVSLASNAASPSTISMEDSEDRPMLEGTLSMDETAAGEFAIMETSGKADIADKDYQSDSRTSSDRTRSA